MAPYTPASMSYAAGKPAIETLVEIMGDKSGLVVSARERVEKASYLIEAHIEDVDGQPGSIQTEVPFAELHHYNANGKLDVLAKILLTTMNIHDKSKEKEKKESKLTKKQQEVADRWLI